MRFIQLLVLAFVVFGVAHADSSGQSNENPFGGNDDNGVYSLPEGQGSNEGPESIQGVRRKREQLYGSVGDVAVDQQQARSLD
uniref:Secreted protein n=1 Tax=Bursaphelenchus xylophilus TaxID=6326 RepID=A0A1I7SX69_BURXY